MAYAYESVFQAVKGMVIPCHRLPVSPHGGAPQIPVSFFRTLLKPCAFNDKFVRHAAESVVPRRQLVYCRSESCWKALVDRRLTRALQFVRCLADDAFVLGYGRFSEDELVSQVLRWFILDWSGVGIKQVKLHLVWLSGFGRGVSAPTEGLLDLPGLVLTNHYRLWLKQQMNKREATLFINWPQFEKRYRCELSDIIAETCLLGTKRGFPSEEDDMVELAMREYAKQMSTDLPQVRPLVGPVVLHRVKEAIRSTAFEIFGHVDEIDYRPFQPSRRAGFGAPIMHGGIAGALLRDQITSISHELVRMVHWATEVVEVRAYILDSRKVYEEMLRRWGGIGCGAIAQCQVYFIREPLKLRTITAGTPSLYGGLAPFLKHLRKGMKRFDCFSLTRGVSDGSIVAAAMNKNPLGSRTCRIGSEVWDMFVSGDYQQSTNDLAMWATESALDAIFSGRARRIADKALGAQEINWSAGRGSDEIKFVQGRGQLMGSPLSFPILCAINAALARLAYELVYPELEGISIDRLPILINGDDFLARMNDAVYAEWQYLISVVGWKLSPGKSYYLRNYAQINSETRHVYRLFDVRDDDLPALESLTASELEAAYEVLGAGLAARQSPTEGRKIRYAFSEPIPFVNGGSLQQMKKTTEQIDRSSVATMSLDWQERWLGMERLPLAMCQRARYVMENNLDSLLQDLFVTGRTPFLLNRSNPVHLGGLGMGKDVEIDWQRCWYGLHTKAPATETLKFRSKLDEPPTRQMTKKEKTQLQKSFAEAMQEPLLVWRDESRFGEPTEPGPLNQTRLLDLLVDDLCVYAYRRPDPKRGLPGDFLDPTCNTVVNHHENRCAVEEPLYFDGHALWRDHEALRAACV